MHPLLIEDSLIKTIRFYNDTTWLEYSKMGMVKQTIKTIKKKIQ